MRGRSEVLAHGGLTVGRPDLVRIGDGLYCLRFETMKVLSAMGAVEYLLDAGCVRRGDTLVDSSSGLYAHALALACHRYGMRCHIIGSTTVDPVLRHQLHHLGATLEQMPSTTDLKHDQHRRVARVEELLAENPRMHWMRQYHDAIHRRGYAGVAQLLIEELGRAPMTVVGGIGTGASSAGLSDHLEAAGVGDLRMVGIQPFGSVTFGAEHVDDPEIIIAGIGSSIRFDNVRHELFDEIHWMSFDVARHGTRALLRDHALFAGLSSGAAYLAAQCESTPDRSIVFLAPDTGHRYVDAVFAPTNVPTTVSEPVRVAGRHELRLPWCQMTWSRRPAPTGSARTPLDARPDRE